MKKHKVLLLVLFIFFVFLALSNCSPDSEREGSNVLSQTFEKITPEEVKDKIKQQEDAVLLDVRTFEEFNGPLGHLPGAIDIPYTELEKTSLNILGDKNREIIVYCRSGNRGSIGSDILAKAGFKNVKNMSGGMLEWNRLYSIPENFETKK